MDSSATHHLTSELANLNVKAEEYSGSDTIRVGDGNGLPIHHIGTTQITTPSLKLQLNNMLHVPHICQHLLFVQHFTKDTNTFFEFHPSYFLLKDRATGKLLLQGPCNHGLYQISATQNKCVPSAFSGEHSTLSLWHARMGHISFQIVHRILRQLQVPVHRHFISKKCFVCLSSNSQQLPVSTSLTQVTKPLALIYTDV